MEVKSAAWATVAVVIAAFGGVAIYTIDKETLSKDISSARRQLAEKESLQKTREIAIKDQRSRLGVLQEKTGELDSLKQATAKLLAGNKELDKTSVELRSRWAQTRDGFERDIEKVRQRVKDEKMPSLVLVDGETLKHAKLTGVEDRVALFEHDAGLAKVPLTNLPANLVGQIALDWNPGLPAELLPTLSPAEIAAAKQKAAAVASEEESRAAEAEGVAAAAEAEGAKSKSDSKIRDLAAKIATLQRSQVAASKGRAEQLRIYEEYAAKYNNARANGRANSHNVRRDDALAKADKFTQQALNCEVEIRRLQGEMDRLR